MQLIVVSGLHSLPSCFPLLCELRWSWLTYPPVVTLCGVWTFMAKWAFEPCLLLVPSVCIGPSWTSVSLVRSIETLFLKSYAELLLFGLFISRSDYNLITIIFKSPPPLHNDAGLCVGLSHEILIKYNVVMKENVKNQKILQGTAVSTISMETCTSCGPSCVTAPSWWLRGITAEDQL